MHKKQNCKFPRTSFALKFDFFFVKHVSDMFDMMFCFGPSTDTLKTDISN